MNEPSTRRTSFLLLILAILGIGVVSWWRWQQPASLPVALEPAPHHAIDRPGPQDAASVDVASESGASRIEARGSAAHEAGVYVVVLDADGVPVVGEQVSAHVWPGGATPIVMAVTGDQPPTFLGKLATGRYTLRTARGQSAYFRHGAGERTVVPVRLGGNRVEGVVIDANGLPVAAAELAVDHPDDGVAAVVGRTGADGRFALASIRPGILLRALAAGREPSKPVAAPARGGELVLVLGGSCGVVHVRAVDAADGHRLSGWCHCAARSGAAVAGMGAVAGFAAEQRVDAAEGCQLRSLPPDGCVLTVRVDGYAPARVDCDSTVSGVRQVEVRMWRGATIAVVVQDVDGAPVSGATVRTGGGYANTSDVTRRDGSAALVCVPSGAVTIVANSIGREARQTLTVTEGQQAACTIRLEGSVAVVGRCVDERHVPLAGLRIELHAASPGADAVVRLVTDEQGGFQLRNGLPIAYDAWVYTSNTQPLPAVRQRLELGGSPFTVVVPANKRGSGWIEGRFTDADAKSAAIQVAVESGEGQSEMLQVACDQDGHFAAGPLPPGTYALALLVPGVHAAPIGTLVLAQDERRDIGVITRPGSGSCSIVVAGLRADDHAGISLVRGGVQVALARNASTFAADGITAGRYSLVTSGALPPVLREIAIVAGAATQEVVSLTGVHGVDLVVQMRELDSVRHFRMEIRAASGEVLRQQSWYQAGEANVTVPLALVPGSYEISLETSDGLRSRTVVQASGKAQRFLMEMF